ncbi:actin-related protein 2/3 complex subunit 3-like isoform X1 [Beta vulgaris subsp. vulgaris]|uniref:actin-related protein 2/3 complex subunit 3-like isoform X1 n=1 Tax=Beta vulgaris subsp. vulgaris TaxID=3555 RepID=UPI00203732EF|nr:actin-related protein 2/3 complex subunit 3-like isoform X1 [Beta vulgaris subsp. vulgaris]
MVYHSSFVDEEGVTKACGCPLLPLKTHIKGPAPVSDQESTDIVDESITFFRANVFFRNFDIKSSADKLLIYLTYYINIALKRLEGCRTLAEGTKAIINLGLEDVPVPGEPGFPFPGLFSPPKSHKEAGPTVLLGYSMENISVFGLNEVSSFETYVCVVTWNRILSTSFSLVLNTSLNNI